MIVLAKIRIGSIVKNVDVEKDGLFRLCLGCQIQFGHNLAA